jgi:glycosyltransferase involved in cell wall biosynthesis
MHILLIHQAFAEIDEAGGTRHHEIARRLVEKGHRVTVLSGQVSYLTGERTVSPAVLHRSYDEVGVEVWRCLSYAGWHRSFLHRMLSFFTFTLTSVIIGLFVRDVDAIWGTSPPIFQGFSAWVIARLKRRPFLFEVRDIWPYFAVEVGVLRQPVLIRLAEWLERFLYRKAEIVVVNSPGYVSHVSERGARDVRIVPNGVDLSLFPENQDSVVFRKANNIEAGFIVMYAGAHGLSNDLSVVLHAAARLERETDIHFVFVGDGKEKDALVEQAHSLELKNVLFLPPVPKNEIGAVLVGAEACIAILKPINAYKMTYPNKVFDYMAAGKAVLLMIDGVIREVVEVAHAGIFIPPGDAEALVQGIQELKSDPINTVEMGRRGRSYVRDHFARSDLADKMEEILIEIVGGKRLAVTDVERTTLGDR